ncbi:MAG: hypothetical protein K2K55_07210, partial [Duncaniella sp.]|nr:hypothetical protein [Duncaniella sp.]
MHTKIFIFPLIALLASSACKAQSSEPTDSLTRELQEVVVTARQPSTKLVGSTLVSTIAGTNLADLGTALDVLAQLPMIKVDGNTVSVVGKNNVEIYIDGRPMRDEGELSHLLSSNLKKVELNMAPGSEFGSTTDAVLRITTRRNFVRGLSLTDQFQLQRRRRWSVMDNLSLNYRARKWDFFLEGTFNRNTSVNKATPLNSLVYEGEK